MKLKRQSQIIAGVVLLVVVGAVVFFGTTGKPSCSSAPGSATSATNYAHIEINVCNGQLVGPLSTFTVKTETPVELQINSDKFGKIGAPVDPPQTITFTQSPVISHFTATKAGTFPITYLANGSDTPIEIGVLTVNDSNK